LTPQELPDYEEFYTNEYGAIRRKKVRDVFFTQGLKNHEIVDLYRNWRDDPEFFILRGIVPDRYEQERLIRLDTAELMDQDTWYLPVEEDYLYRFIKASKRGNDVYKYLVEKKLTPLQKLSNIAFFNDHSEDKRTCLLFLTLTYDPKKCDHHTAWKNIGSEFHLFCNNLRKKYGKIEFFRTWESTNHYYPHVHIVMLFWEKNFVVIPHKDKDGKLSYRIPYKDKQEIAKHWHSWVDVEAVKDTDGAVKELTKYITKDLCSNKGDLTNAMIWFHGKQGYSVSKGFIESIWNWNLTIDYWNTDFKEPTNRDLITEMCNCNHDVVKWEFIGILRGHDLGFSPDIWCVDLKKPPPKVLDLIKNEFIRWKSLHGGIMR
jgi:hypothetical protein